MIIDIFQGLLHWLDRIMNSEFSHNSRHMIHHLSLLGTWFIIFCFLNCTRSLDLISVGEVVLWKRWNFFMTFWLFGKSFENVIATVTRTCGRTRYWTCGIDKLFCDLVICPSFGRRCFGVSNLVSQCGFSYFVLHSYPFPPLMRTSNS
jgi:hypothetical protein